MLELLAALLGRHHPLGVLPHADEIPLRILLAQHWGA